MDVIQHLLPSNQVPVPPMAGRNQVMWFPEREISVESFVVGALEATFHQMVNELPGKHKETLSTVVHFISIFYGGYVGQPHCRRPVEIPGDWRLHGGRLPLYLRKVIRGERRRLPGGAMPRSESIPFVQRLYPGNGTSANSEISCSSA